MTPPEFRDNIATFSVTFPNHTLFDAETLAWLAEIGADQLSDDQRVGLALVRNGQALSNEVYRKFNTVDGRVATRDLRELVQRALLHPLGSGRWPTYRLSDPAAEQVALPIEDSRSATPPRARRAAVARRILAVLAERGELARADMVELLETPDSTIRYWLRNLREAGLIEPTTQSPRSPATKYRLVRQPENT